MIQFAESFRLHADMAEFLRREVYRQDGIAYHSQQARRAADVRPIADAFVAAVLAPEHPLVVVVHDEAREPGAQPLRAGADRADPRGAGRPGAATAWTPRDGLGVVVPHRAQRAALQAAVPGLTVLDPATGAVTLLGGRHGRAVPGRRADGHPGQRDRERPGLPAGLQRVPARPAPADRGLEPGQAEDDPGRLPLRLRRCSAPTRRRSPTPSSGRTCCAGPARRRSGTASGRATGRGLGQRPVR